MKKPRTVKLFILLLIFALCIYEAQSQLHRVKNNQASSQNDDNEFKITSNRLKIKKPWLTWISSIIGATFVGLSGVLPFLIIPQIAHNHEDLSRFKTSWINFFFKFNILLSKSKQQLLSVCVHLQLVVY